MIVPDPEPAVQVPPTTVTGSAAPVPDTYTEYGAFMLFEVLIPRGHGVSVTVAWVPPVNDAGLEGACVQL